VERKHRDGEIALPKSILQDPAPHEQSNHVFCREEKVDDDEKPWVVHLSKKAKKLLKSLQKEPSIKWRNEVTPVIPSLPKEIKVFYKKNEGSKKKKSRKPAKQTDIQKYVDALKEYNPGNPIPAILRDYIPKKVWDKLMGIPDEEEKHVKATNKGKEKVVEEEDIEKVEVETIDSNYEDDDENIWGDACLMMSHIDFCDYEACDVVVHGAEFEEENFPSLRKLFCLKEEGETSKSKIANCKVILRSGTQIPERQAPKEASRRKDKALEKKQGY
jgi:hypothetical protein